ncbi:TPA: RHS domain-containing protein, partial [Enterobacter hormaechei]|nr:RHS domain-containing protein [Enterobacter hormaechei]
MLPSVSCQYTRDELLRENSRTQGLLTTRSEYERLGRLHRRDVFTGNAQRPSPRRWSRRRDYDYRLNLVREERDDNPFSWYRWHYRYNSEHRLTEVISQPRDRNKPQTQVSFRYDPLGRRISKTRRQVLGGQPIGKPVTIRFVWEGFRLLQEVHGDVPLTYVYSDQDSYDPLARIDGVDTPEIFWFHCQPNGTPERMTDIEGQVRWEGVNSAWGKLLRESETQLSGYSQNLRMQG